MSLNLFYSLNPVSLADSMIDKINGCWNDPFDPPTVIFPDKMVEQWFKLYWLGKGNKALINLRFEKTDQFLFNLLQNENGAKNISSDLLRLAIIKKLTNNYEFDSSESNVRNYIYDNDTINYNRLYDFAKIMADLLLDYERTRQDWDSSNVDVDIYSPWYKSEVKLYNNLFEDGYIDLNREKYSTFNQLFRKSRCSFIDLKDHKPIFVFGFSGLGETYVNVLSTISKSCDVNVYLQADDKYNCSFAVHGKKSLEIWKKIADYKECFSGFVHPIDKSNEDFIPKFVAAPSKLREIDKLHNEICCLLENENDAPMLKDIKVFAPNVKDYIPEISLVFDQKVKQEGVGNVAIPYSISDYSAKTSCVYEAVNILFRIFEKGDFSRADFIKLIKNPVVQATRGITEDAVDNWANWIKEINVYRKSSWESAKKRLLLAKLTYDPVDGVNPYDPIGRDDELLFKFIEMIEELGKWAQTDTDNKIIDLNTEKVREILRNMISIGRVKDKSLDGERAVYLSVMGAMRNLEKVFGDNEINYKVVFLTVQDSIKGVSLSSSGDAKGIEFITFRPGRVIPARYSFFIGMDSESFPGSDQRNALDVREDLQEEKNTLRNKNTLYCQIEATEKEVHFSYVNKDLQKDKDLYKSSVLNDIAKMLGRTSKNRDIEELIKIDANWSTQFTPRNRRDNSILGDNTKIPVISKEEYKIPEPPKRVTVSQLRKFLEEPLKFQVESVFGYGDDDIENEEAEFEPVGLDYLTNSVLSRKYLKERTDDEVIKKELSALFSSKLYADNASEKLLIQVNNIRSSLEKTCTDYQIPYNEIRFEKNDEVLVDDSFRISGRFAYHFSNVQKKQLFVFDIKSSFTTKHYLNSYVSALALVAEAGGDAAYDVFLFLINPDTGEKKLRSFRITAEESKTVLTEIYKMAFEVCFSDLVPFEKTADKETLLCNIKELDALCAETNNRLPMDKLTVFFPDALMKKFIAIWNCFDGIEFQADDLNALSDAYINNNNKIKAKAKDKVGPFIAKLKNRESFSVEEFLSDYGLKDKEIVCQKYSLLYDSFINSDNNSISPENLKDILKELSDRKQSEVIDDYFSLFKTFSEGFLSKEKVRELLEKKYHNKKTDIYSLVESANGEHGAWSFFDKSRIIEIPDGLGYSSEEDAFNKQWESNTTSVLAVLEKMIGSEGM